MYFVLIYFVLPVFGAEIMGSTLDLKCSFLCGMPLFNSGLSMLIANKIDPKPVERIQ